MSAKTEIEEIETILNNLNLATAKYQIGKMFVRLLARVEELEAGGGGGQEPTTVSWSDIEGKPSTYPPAIGTTATTAKAGNYAPTWAEVSGKPATFPPQIGSTASTAAAGNHDHAITADAASGLLAAASIQALAVALSTRIKALEDAV